MIFGLYTKSSGVDLLIAEPAIASFSLDRERELERVHGARFVGASTRTGGASLPCVQAGSRIVLAAGHPSGDVSIPDAVAALDVVEGAPKGAKGNFVFARYDGAKEELVLGNDAFGFQPLFIVETPEFVAFCSEYEPLLELPGITRDLDHDATAQYYVFGLTLGSRTLLKDVTMLPPGTIRTFGSQGSRDHRYDDIAIAIKHGGTLESHAKEVGAAFQEAVQRGMDAYPEANVGLTGGADTRLILSCMTPEQRQRHRFETHYAEEGAESRDRDVVVANMLAKKTGISVDAIFLEQGHKPFEPSVFDFHRRKSHTEGTMHAGVLGGEYLGGCCVDVALFPALKVTREAVANRLRDVFAAPFIDSLQEDPYDTLQAELSALKCENREMAFWINAFGRPFFSQLYFGTQGIRTSTWMVPWQMHQRLVSPFADPDFLRALLAVPFKFISGYNLYNAVYKHAFPELTDVPTNSGLAVRSDSAIAMYMAGEEPKKARIERVNRGRQAAIKRHSGADGAPIRDVYNGAWMRDSLKSDLDASANPSTMTRLKNVYTRSPLFKLRHVLPIHSWLMNWKAKRETESAARVSMEVVPMFADFEDWCAYSKVEFQEDAMRKPRLAS